MLATDAYAILRDLLRATAPFSGLRFLAAASQALATQFQANFVFITQTLEVPADSVKMLAAWRDGKEVEGWEFALRGTPCDLIYHETPDDEWQAARVGANVMIAENVCRRFISTQNTSYQAFIGAPLWSAERQMVGHLALFFDRALSDETERAVMFELVELFALKVQAELGRMLLEQTRERILDDLKKVNQQLLHDSITDSLTQLYNRRYFTRRIQQAYARFVRSAEPYALLLLDVDRFKSINDTYGHDAGDMVLRAIADVLGDNTRSKVELVFRTGGEEFAILCHGPITPVRLASLGDRINRAVKQSRFAGDWGAAEVTVSIGAAMPRTEDTSWNAVYVRADAAMYEAKSDGGDRSLVDA